MKNKPITPIQALTQGIKKPFYEQLATEEEISVEPMDCLPWKFHDRHDAWMNKERCHDLIKSISGHGQKIPAIARILHNDKQHNIKYEIIAGKRRWFACKTLGIKLKIKLLSLTDQQASILMHIENKDRQDITDFERALNFRNQYDHKLFNSLVEMAQTFSISKTQMIRMIKATNILNYSAICNQIQDVTQIGIKYSYELVSFLENHPLTEKEMLIHLSALSKTSQKLSPNKLLQYLISKIKNVPVKTNDSILKNKNGAVICEYKKKNNQIIIFVNLNETQINKNELINFCEATINKHIEER